MTEEPRADRFTHRGGGSHEVRAAAWVVLPERDECQHVERARRPEERRITAEGGDTFAVQHLRARNIARDEPEYARVMAATQLLANYFDGYFQQQGMYKQTWPDSKWKSYIQDHAANSPVLRRYVVANPMWFASEFVQMCKSAAVVHVEQGAAPDGAA